MIRQCVQGLDLKVESVRVMGCCDFLSTVVILYAAFVGITSSLNPEGSMSAVNIALCQKQEVRNHNDLKRKIQIRVFE